MSEEGGQVLRLRSQRRDITKVTFSSHETNFHKETLEESASDMSHDSAFSENCIFENGSIESSTYHSNKESSANGWVTEETSTLETGLEDKAENDSPWQNGRYKPAKEIVSYYRSLGDWWNYLPKTDNTYNPMSKWYRKEIAPGIPVIPNMARPPLRPVMLKSSRFSQLLNDVLSTESVVSTSTNTTSTNTMSTNIRQRSWFRKIETVITKVVTTVWSVITFSSSSVSSCKASETINGNHSVLDKSDAASWADSSSSVDSKKTEMSTSLFTWLYSVMVSLLCMDVFILTSVRRAFSRVLSKRLLKILLLPLFLIPFLVFCWSMLSNHRKALLAEAEWIINTGIPDHSSILSSTGQSITNTFLYLYGLLSLLPSLLWWPHSSSQSFTATGEGGQAVSMTREQVIFLVEEAVRETMRRESAALLESTMNQPRFKVLLEKVLAEKMDKWDPATLLTNEQWRAAIRDAVHVYNSETSNKEGDMIRQRLGDIEKKTEDITREILKLNERDLALEKAIDSALHQFVNRNSEDKITKIVLDEVMQKVKVEVTNLYYSLRNTHIHQEEVTVSENFNLTQVRDYVGAMIERALLIYDADKTGMVDYALETSGGNVLSTRCTESYSARQPTYFLFGFALWHSSNSPRTIIQPGVHPGECWAFTGQGYVVIRLSATVMVNAFTMEHIPRSLSPHGRIDSAPKDFSVWGLKFEDDKDPTSLGRFRFQENGTSLQKFNAEPVEEPFGFVELKIESNHGNIDYTCLYRFRVHGVPVS